MGKEFKGLRALSSGPIKSVETLYEEMREIVYNVTNLWSWRYNTTTMYRMRLPGFAEVIMSGHNTNEKKHYKVPRFLLDDTSLCCKEKQDPLGHTGVMSSNVSAVVHTHHATGNFPHILLLLKLRWLLKLHSALCELDHRVCSLKNFITGLHRLSLQQCKAVPCDNAFSTRSLPQELNVHSLVDDMIEQLMRSMGQGFEGFVHFVQSCDSTRALCNSTSDLTQPKVTSNAYLSEMIDDIYMAYYLRLPATNKMLDLCHDLEAFSIALPDVYVLEVDYLRWWMGSTSSKTKHFREKSAQLQALRAVAAIEMEELGMHAMEDEDFLDGKPALTQTAMEALFMIVGSHATFPAGLRARLCENLRTRYNLSEKHRRSLVVLTQMNLDLPKLSADQMATLKVLELERLHARLETFYDTDLTCLTSSLVPMPTKAHQTADYTHDACLPKDLSPYRTTSLPKLATMAGRDKFKVPLITGPLVYDHHLETLRTTGYFQQMANLGP